MIKNNRLCYLSFSVQYILQGIPINTFSLLWNKPNLQVLGCTVFRNRCSRRWFWFRWTIRFQNNLFLQCYELCEFLARCALVQFEASVYYDVTYVTRVLLNKFSLKQKNKNERLDKPKFQHFSNFFSFVGKTILFLKTFKSEAIIRDYFRSFETKKKQQTSIFMSIFLGGLQFLEFQKLQFS